ncbi:hypothetical protein [Haloplanus halophilus]|uniref:hypothetical protein n=1 Tax=Haloplanus halophilus TaxID=2949993 RepID=UPI00203FD4EC|nr:hypothetical protein [Haloplanus sp. GDY1]
MSTDDADSLLDRFPEPDLDVEAPDAYALLAGVFTLHLGAEMSYAREPSIIWGIASMYVFATALVLIGSGVSTVDVRRWGRPLSGAAFLAIMSALGVIYLMIHGSPINTDALDFVNTAAGTLLSGQSPYIVSMHSGGEFPTPMVGGGHVNQYSYPIGSAVVAAPFVAIAEDGSRIAVLLFTFLAGVVLIGSAPHELAPLALFSLLVGDFITWGVSDLTDPLWVAPLLAAIYFWPWSRVGRDSLRWSAVLFGIAMAMKQQPWFCAPFLMLWVWHERGRWTAARYVGTVAGTFGLIHLPVFVLAPEAAVVGLLTNLYGPSGTLVHLGVGLSALTLSGAFPIAKGAHTLLMALVGIGSVVAYWTYFDRLRWLAWLAWAPLLFFNYRSLANYFIVCAPIAVMLLNGRLGRETEVSTSA